MWSEKETGQAGEAEQAGDRERADLVTGKPEAEPLWREGMNICAGLPDFVIGERIGSVI